MLWSTLWLRLAPACRPLPPKLEAAWARLQQEQAALRLGRRSLWGEEQVRRWRQAEWAAACARPACCSAHGPAATARAIPCCYSSRGLSTASAQWVSSRVGSHSSSHRCLAAAGAVPPAGPPRGKAGAPGDRGGGDPGGGQLLPARARTRTRGGRRVLPAARGGRRHALPAGEWQLGCGRGMSGARRLGVVGRQRAIGVLMGHRPVPQSWCRSSRCTAAWVGGRAGCRQQLGGRGGGAQGWG